MPHILKKLKEHKKISTISNNQILFLDVKEEFMTNRNMILI